MELAKVLADEGHEPRSIDTRAKIRLSTPDEGVPSIEDIHLTTTGDVPGIDTKRFLELAERAKRGCIVSRVLSTAPVRIDAELAR